jgi:hypothetical protein
MQRVRDGWMTFAQGVHCGWKRTYGLRMAGWR